MSHKDHTQANASREGCCSGESGAQPEGCCSGESGAGKDLTGAIQSGAIQSGAIQSGAIHWPEDVDGNSDDPAHTGDELPGLSCKLSSTQRAGRRAKVIEPMREAVVGVREFDDGYALEFGSDRGVLKMVLAFVEVERRCCPFCHFGIQVTPNHGPIWLELRGSPDVKRALAEQPEFVELLRRD